MTVLAEIFVDAESVLTYFYIVVTLTFTYEETGRLRRRWKLVLLSTLLFALIFKPLEIRIGGYYLYLAATLLGALLYCALFLRSRFLVSCVMLLYLMYSVVAAKAVVLCLLSPIEDGYSLSNILLRACLYAIFFLQFVYFSGHPISPGQRMPGSFWVLFVLSPLLLVICIEYMTQWNNGTIEGIFLPVYLGMYGSLLLTYYLSYVLMRSYESRMETAFLNQKLELQLEYVQNSSSIIEQVRRERHELKNNYFYIQSLVKRGSYDELSRFLDEEMGRRLELTEEFNTGSRMADYILTQKVNEARSHGIHVVTVAMLPPDLKLRDADLCAILMNLLDNAIEASLEEEHGDIRIQIGVSKEYLSLQVRNLVSADVLAENPNLTTKKADAAQHGIGLKIIRQTVERYHGFFDTHMESGYFVATAMLPDCLPEQTAPEDPPPFRP